MALRADAWTCGGRTTLGAQARLPRSMDAHATAAWAGFLGVWQTRRVDWMVDCNKAGKAGYIVTPPHRCSRVAVLCPHSFGDLVVCHMYVMTRTCSSCTIGDMVQTARNQLPELQLLQAGPLGLILRRIPGGARLDSPTPHALSVTDATGRRVVWSSVR